MRKPAMVKKQDVFQHLESAQYQSQAFYGISDQKTRGEKVEGKVVEIHDKRENKVIMLYNEIYIFTSAHKTNTCSK